MYGTRTTAVDWGFVLNRTTDETGRKRGRSLQPERLPHRLQVPLAARAPFFVPLVADGQEDHGRNEYSQHRGQDYGNLNRCHTNPPS